MASLERTDDLFWVDVFIGDRATGNPAGVVLLDADARDGDLQAVATELGLAETAFLRDTPDGLVLRWFTPSLEVDLCGHATMATVVAMERAGRIESGQRVVFTTRFGTLDGVAGGTSPTITLPRSELTSCLPPERDPVPGAIAWFEGGVFVVAELPSADEVLAYEPQDRVEHAGLDRGLIVMAMGGDDTDVTMRMFAPVWGLPEDPATGGAQCVLAPLASSRLGRSTVYTHQASPRGGRLTSTVHPTTVNLTGGTCVVFSGRLSEERAPWRT